MTGGAQLRIIADDLTGAADAGVCYCAPGTEVVVLLTPNDPRWRNPPSPVVVVDTDTRDAAIEASQKVLAELALGIGEATVLKKVDSALRGHVAAELKVLRAHMSDHLVVVAPAFPAAGRFTRDGTQYVTTTPSGRPNTRAVEMLRPPRSLRDLLSSQPHALITLDEVRCDTNRMGARLDRLARESRIAICDAESDTDLDRIVSAGRAARHQVLWVGSAGLAAALARHLGYNACAGPVALSPMHRRSPERYLAVVGSTEHLAHLQVSRLLEDGAAPVPIPVRLLASNHGGTLEALTSRVFQQASQGDAVVWVDGEVSVSARGRVRRNLAAVVHQAANACQLLVLTGGATAHSVLLACGLTSLRLSAEIEPGVVLSVTGRSAPAEVLTKAGTFGDEGTLKRAIRCITEQRGRT